MDARQERGKLLAQGQGQRIKQVDGPLWYVPSQREGGYLVNVETGKCSCPDEADRCKHLVAVDLVRGALAKADVAPVVPAPAKVPQVPEWSKGRGRRRTDLTDEEITHVREVLHYLRAPHRGWGPLGKLLRFRPKTLQLAAKSRAPSPKLVFRLARLARVSVDVVLTGRFPPTSGNRCPTCGRRIHRDGPGGAQPGQSGGRAGGTGQLQPLPPAT